MPGQRTQWIDFEPSWLEDHDGSEVVIDLIDAGPDDEPGGHGSRPVPRMVGWISLVVGVVGIVFGLLLMWLGFGVVDRAASTIDGGLALADDSIVAVLNTLDVAEETVEITADSLLEMQVSLASVTGSIRRVDGLLGETSDIVSGDLAESLDALLDALPGLIDVGDTLDRTLRSLAFLGVPYDPSAPIGDGFREMERALIDVPPRLREQGALLDDMRTDLVSTRGSLDRVRGDVGQIRGQLADTGRLFDGYRRAAVDGSGLVSDIRAQVERGAPTAKIALVAFGLFVIIYQVVPMYLGWRLVRGEPLVGSG